MVESVMPSDLGSKTNYICGKPQLGVTIVLTLVHRLVSELEAERQALEERDIYTHSIIGRISCFT
ncbi:MAG: hypothetical protein V1253_02885, partial [Alphaproteobacteria bacterium]|nr:hypothetical protein [Alphaproteobacteria bacterium]